MSDSFSVNGIIRFAETWLGNSDNVLFWVMKIDLKKSILKRSDDIVKAEPQVVCQSFWGNQFHQVVLS